MLFRSGLIAVAAGQPWGDPVAGLAVTAFICHVGNEVTADVVRRLANGIDPSVITGAEAAAGSVPGVIHAHARARWTGRTLLPGGTSTPSYQDRLPDGPSAPPRVPRLVSPDRARSQLRSAASQPHQSDHATEPCPPRVSPSSRAHPGPAIEPYPPRSRHRTGAIAPRRR